MRPSTAFNKMLANEGATVTTVSFTPEGVVVGLRLRARRLRCPRGFTTGAVYDRSKRRWRHLDLGHAGSCSKPRSGDCTAPTASA